MRVLVTGAAGFIGSHVTDALLAQGHEVAALDNLSSGRRENLPRHVPLYHVDLRDRAATARALADFRPQAVSHQAAQASVALSVRDPGLDAEVNVMGGAHLLDACSQPGSRVERFVFASTGGAIYGEVPEPSRAGEDALPAPSSPYAQHKLVFERLLTRYAGTRPLDSTILRYANVYGPRQDPRGEAGVVATFFDSARAGRKLRINARRQLGDEGCARDYVFVTDVVRANLLALSGHIDDGVLNVGTGAATSTRELAVTISRSVGCELLLEFAPPRPGDLERSVLDPALVERYLGSLTELAVGLDHTHHFYAARAA